MNKPSKKTLAKKTKKNGAFKLELVLPDKDQKPLFSGNPPKGDLNLRVKEKTIGTLIACAGNRGMSIDELVDELAEMLDRLDGSLIRH